MPQCRVWPPFCPLLPEGKLSPAHYQHILSAYHLTDATPQKQAETLFCLSTAFARYSSSAIFGTEHDSPPALRGYAEALMQKARELSPAIFRPANSLPTGPTVFTASMAPLPVPALWRIVCNVMPENISRVFCHPSCHWPGPSPASTRMKLRDTALCPSVHRPVLVHAFLRSRPDCPRPKFHTVLNQNQ